MRNEMKSNGRDLFVLTAGQRELKKGDAQEKNHRSRPTKSVREWDTVTKTRRETFSTREHTSRTSFIESAVGSSDP